MLAKNRYESPCDVTIHLFICSSRVNLLSTNVLRTIQSEKLSREDPLHVNGDVATNKNKTKNPNRGKMWKKNMQNEPYTPIKGYPKSYAASSQC